MNIDWSYAHKLVFHIPHVDYRGDWQEVDYENFKRAVFELLEEHEIKRYYCNDIKAYYKGKAYDEEVITAFVDAGPKNNIISSFKLLSDQYEKLLKLDQFVLEVDGELLVFSNIFDEIINDFKEMV